MSSTPIIPNALLSAALASLGLCLLVEGCVALALSFTPWASDRIALVVNAFDSTSFFGGLRTALLFSNIFPGLLLLLTSRWFALSLFGETSEKSAIQTQERAMIGVGIAVYGVWKLVSGISYICSVLVLSLWKVFGEPGYSLSKSGGIVGIQNFLVGISILLLFRILAKNMNVEAQEAKVTSSS